MMGGQGTPDMPVTPPVFPDRLAAFGTQQPGYIEDRRNEPWNPITAIKGFDHWVMHPLRRDLGIEDSLFPQSNKGQWQSHSMAGKLRDALGYYDVGKK